MEIIGVILLGIIVLQLGWIRTRIDKVNEKLESFPTKK
jgi:hypothetical protein